MYWAANLTGRHRLKLYSTPCRGLMTLLSMRPGSQVSSLVKNTNIMYIEENPPVFLIIGQFSLVSITCSAGADHLNGRKKKAEQLTNVEATALEITY